MTFTSEEYERLPTGDLALWPEKTRAVLGRCLQCEWHPETQGHHPACPERGSDD